MLEMIFPHVLEPLGAPSLVAKSLVDDVGSSIPFPLDQRDRTLLGPCSPGG